MEVIKKGNKNYIYYARCEECGSIISFMKSELDWSHRLDCPICKSSVYADIYLYDSAYNDPYLGDKEVKKEVEEYLSSREKTRASIGKPTYVPKKKEDIDVKIDSDSINEIVGKIKSSDEYESVLEKILKEVVVEALPTYLKDGRLYEPSKTNDWSNPYGVSISNL